MTNSQKAQIKELRDKGYSYSAISSAVDINKSTVAAFCRKHNLAGVMADAKKQSVNLITCLNCGKVLKQKSNVKKMKFCCNKCRTMWWNSHQENVNKRAIYTFICPQCNKEFTAYGNAKRKYCSHACYIKARFKGGDCNE